MTNNFGAWLRWEMKKRRLTIKALGEKIGLGEKRVWDMLQMDKPRIFPQNEAGLAQAFGINLDAFEQTWRRARVPKPVRKKWRNTRLDRDLYERLALRAETEGKSISDLIDDMLQSREATDTSAVGPRVSQQLRQAGEGHASAPKPRKSPSRRSKQPR